MTGFWCENLVDGGGPNRHVRITADAAGNVVGRTPDVPREEGDIELGTVYPGFGNGHSHAFHRTLRGRTHGDGGDFWQWRREMYRTAASLTPDSYHHLARAVFAEMTAAGYTAVGEFHYVHHRPDGTPYPHAMEEAVDAAAASVGIRLTLLDALYLDGGVGEPLAPEQQRFSDRTVDRYLERWHALRSRVSHLGAAIHSVRAVSPEAMSELVAGIPSDVPLHIHLSEQPGENADSIAAFGMSPTQVLASIGALSPRLSAVHATHLSDDDVALLGDAGVTVVMCPTTEGDLGDGIGPARDLRDAGASLALGSDQNAVIDPFLEMRGLEIHDRLASLRRGRFSPAELVEAGTAAGYRALGLGAPLSVGGPCDLVEVSGSSVRTRGSAVDQLPLTATASDVLRVVVGGEVVAENGILAGGESPSELLDGALRGRVP